ncbi:MAG: hypothetical protein M1834_003829 [Cirrosporium novae-zelandiae]|nr:MAG: hypothetical protein M1834_003829 [Cirrosporium novae-zelandiae]
MAGQNVVNAMGGPVGGMPMMNAMNSAQTSRNDGDSPPYLNTYIYDYFIKNGLYDCARSLLHSDAHILTHTEQTKTSPGRKDEVNGVDNDAMDTDKDHMKIPQDLPRPKLVEDGSSSAFLVDWWSLFWDIFSERGKKAEMAPGMGGPAAQYVQHSRHQSRMRQDQQQMLLRQQNFPAHLNPGQMNQFQAMRMQQNGLALSQNDLQKRAMQNSSRNATPQAMQIMQNKQIMQQHPMQRNDSDIDINGQRPQSPSSTENAPSPSKRPRLDSTPFNGQQMGPNGRVMQGQATQQMLMANGINPSQLNPAQMQNFQNQNATVQQKSIQVYAQNLALHQRAAMDNRAFQKGIPNPAMMANQGSPMMQPMPDGQMAIPMEYYNNPAATAAQMRALGAQNGTSGNHALQDYQMQLMLLEQQNKKRLLMARQEQETNPRNDGGPLGGPGGPGFPPGMSPQGSRSGPSPNPNEQMKREAKMGQPGMPGSPLPDGNGLPARSSPANMNFPQNGQIPPDMQPQFFNQMKMGEAMGGMMQNGTVMRPPSSHPGFNGQPISAPMELTRAQQVGVRGPSGNWQQGPQGQAPMMQQPPPAQQPQAMGTPQQRNAMPPPQAPPAGNGRQQPSPQQNPAPPTPQQSNKPNPKNKKDGKEPRKRPNKKGNAANPNAGATPSSEPDPPPTPTPSTPITPVNAHSFNGPKPPTAPNPSATAVPPPASTAPPAPVVPVAPPQPEPAQVPNFAGLDASDNAGNYSLDFSNLDTGDVLENFDFDSFLQGGDESGNFNFDTSLGYSDGVEAGGGDSLVQ